MLNGFSRKLILILMIIAVCINLVGLEGFANSASEGEKVPTLNFLTATPEYDRSRYEASLLIQESLEKLGLKIRISPVDLTVITKTARTEPWDFDIFIKGWGATPDRIDPHFFIYSFLHSAEIKNLGYNRLGHSNAEYDKVVNMAEATMDLKERQKYIYEAQRLLVEDVGYFPLYYENSYQPYNSKRLEGVVIQGGIGINTYQNLLNVKIKEGPNVLKIANTQDNDLLNPLTTALYVDAQILDLIYDNLARLNEDNEPVPCAAESWEIVDNKTVKVKLKDNLTFHDGEKLTAEDVKFTFDYGKKWVFHKVGTYIKPVESVEVIDSTTLIFHLIEPVGFFISASFTSVPILPQHIWKDLVEKEGLENPHEWPNLNPVGSGPFKFNYWRRGEETRLDAFQNYHAPINIDSIIIKPYTNNDAIGLAIKTGEMDMYGGATLMSPMQMQEFEKTEGIGIAKTAGIGFTHFGFNQRRMPFKDLAFRKAVAHVIDVNTIVETVSSGYATPAGVGRIISPANKFWYNPDLPSYEFNVEKARQILEDAGYSWDENGNLCYPK